MKAVKLIAAASVLALMAGAGSAATVTQTFTKPQEVNPTVATGTAAFERFDASKGTLTGVTLTLVGDFVSYLWVEAILNRETHAQNGWFAESFLRASSEVFGEAEAALAKGTYQDVTSPGLGVRSYSPGVERSGVIEFLFADASDLERFIGGDAFEVDLGIYNEEPYGGSYPGIWAGFKIPGGNGKAGVKTNYGLSATLTYDFAPAAVPVPAAGLLLLTAMGGLGVAASRRKAPKAA